MTINDIGYILHPRKGFKDFLIAGFPVESNSCNQR